jgi:DGQHR domain-containing protein
MIKEINGENYLYLVYQKVEQPIGVFYITSIPWYILRKIAFVNPRILMGKDDDGKEIYEGIQRKLSLERKEEIKKYITGGTATFPSSVIINIPKDELRIDTLVLNSLIALDEQQLLDNRQLKSLDNLEIELRNEIFLLIVRYQEGIAQIIDGQHRLPGFEAIDADSIVFDLPVTIFLKQSPYDQAEIFATINSKQTRFTPSLVYDLFGISNKKKPIYDCHIYSEVS